MNAVVAYQYIVLLATTSIIIISIENDRNKTYKRIARILRKRRLNRKKKITLDLRDVCPGFTTSSSNPSSDDRVSVGGGSPKT